MLLSYRELRRSIFVKKNSNMDIQEKLNIQEKINIQEKERSTVVTTDKAKFSVKELFVKRNKVKVEEKDPGNSSLLASDALLNGQKQSTSNLVVNAEVAEALQTVFEALHDPSILDARRHQRYDLYAPFIVPETPPDIARQLEVIQGRTTTSSREIATAHPHAAVPHSSAPPPIRAAGAAAAVIELDVDIVEVMRIPPRSARGENGSLISEIAAQDLLNVGCAEAAACPLTPNPGTPGHSIAVCMASSGTSLLSAASPKSTPPTSYAGPRVMDIADMRVLRFLGEGTMGKVYFVKDQASNHKVALKVVEKKNKNEYTLSIVVQEVDIQKKLADSPWFVELYASWHDSDNMYIAMTPYPTDLDSEIIRSGRIEPERARFYMAEIIIALTELHKRGIIHRDVKAPNILIDHAGHIVLADFGLSKDFRQCPSIAERIYQPYWPYLPDDNATSAMEERDPTELHFVAWDYRGSELEMAPEVHLGQPYSFGVDFWSAAVVLYWMLTGRPPWFEQEDCDDPEIEVDGKPLAYKIAEDDLCFEPSDEVDSVTQDFLQRMLVKNPKKRLMIDFEMPSHPYFEGVNWPLLEARKLPAPWVPEYEVCHVYEATTAIFTPGEPYADEEADPCPPFTFLSKRARRRIIYEECDDLDSDSEYGFESSAAPAVEDEDIQKEVQEEDGECAGATFVEDPLNEEGVFGEKDGDSNSNVDITLLDSPGADWNVSKFQDASTLQVQSVIEASIKSGSVTTTTDASTSQAGSVLPVTSARNGDVGELLTEKWNVTIINRPPTAPYSPGPKSWLRAQDLIKICPREPATVASSATSAASESMEVMYVPPMPAAVDASAEDHVSDFTHRAQCDDDASSAGADPASPLIETTDTTISTGFFAKAKAWWMSKTWTPKPKKSLGVKRLSC